LPAHGCVYRTRTKAGKREFNAEDVEKEKRRLLAPYAQVVPKPEGNAQIGDIVIADVTVRDGERVLNDLDRGGYC
jgi:FKBP-type peptidyl-prolyl cis-trans isomerase (trigger factor)